MNWEPLDIEGAWLMTPTIHRDDRGSFLEWFRSESFAEAVGHHLDLAQANCSVSARGAVRGIHFADLPPGQAKYVTCVSGRILDVIVDIREGSPTFGNWTSRLLDSASPTAVYVSEGLGHGFAALEDRSTVIYLCSRGYAPEREHEIHPLDPAIGIDWQVSDPQLSPKDSAAPTLATALDAGRLPDWQTCRDYRASLP